MKKSFTFGLLMLLVFAIACCKPVIPDDPVIPDEPDTPENPVDTIPQEPIVIDSTAVLIVYTDTAILISNPLEDLIQIQAQGAHIRVQSAAADMKFVLSGAHSDASFIIDSDSSFSLILDSLSLSSTIGPAIYIQSFERTQVYIKDSTENYLSDALLYNAEYDKEARACLYANGGLIFGGKGKLNLRGNNRHALSSEQFIRIQDGNIELESSVRDGIHTANYFVIDQGNLQITSQSDGIECSSGFIRINGGKLSIHSVDEAIVSSYLGEDSTINSTIIIEQGEIDIYTTGEKGMGIDAGRDLAIYGGNIRIEVEGKASKALRSKGNLFIRGGNLDLTTKGDAVWNNEEGDLSSAAGIKSDGNMVISGAETNILIHSSGSGGKGINASGQLLIEDGNIEVSTIGKRHFYGQLYTSPKGIKSNTGISIEGGKIKVEATGSEGSDGFDTEGSLSIKGGDIEVLAYDDCIKSTRNMTIDNGNIYCYSTHNDGLDTKASLTVNGGFIIASGAQGSKNGVNCDGVFKINGGSLLATGGKNTNPSSTSAQNSVVYSGIGNADEYFHIQTADGDPVMTYQLPRSYSVLKLLYSSSDLIKGKSYAIYQGGEVEGGENIQGMVLGGAYTPGILLKTFSINYTLTTVK